jgi:hypothetical protein
VLSISGDAVAVLYVKTSDMQKVFQFQTDAINVNDLSSQDMKFYVDMSLWPTSQALNPLNPANAMMDVQFIQVELFHLSVKLVVLLMIITRLWSSMILLDTLLKECSILTKQLIYSTINWVLSRTLKVSVTDLLMVTHGTIFLLLYIMLI